jgi:proteasome assembly chaperone 2
MWPSSPKFEGQTLVLPAVSYGNVGQLAVDVLLCTALSTSDATHAGHIQSRHVLPVCGGDAFGVPATATSTISTPCELYHCPSSNAVLLQRRSMCVKGRSNEFALELAQWCKEQKFKQIVLLAGADSGSLRDRAMHEGLQQGLIHYVTSSQVQETFDHCTSWQRFTQAERDPNGDVIAPTTTSTTHTYPSNVHMAGLSKRLFNACEVLKVPVVSLLCFVSEGYNVPDGVRLATSVCEHLPGLAPQSTKESEPGRWVIPASWGSLAPTSPVEPDLFY